MLVFVVKLFIVVGGGSGRTYIEGVCSSEVANAGHIAASVCKSNKNVYFEYITNI